MVVKGDSTTRSGNSSGTQGTPIGLNRYNNAYTELAKFRAGLVNWKPKIGDFIVWHGWFTRWYGVIRQLNGGSAVVIKENLPKLLFTLAESEYDDNSVTIPITKIIRSRGGEYHILQDGVWYFDD